MKPYDELVADLPPRFEWLSLGRFLGFNIAIYIPEDVPQRNREKYISIFENFMKKPGKTDEEYIQEVRRAIGLDEVLASCKESFYRGIAFGVTVSILVAYIAWIISWFV